MATPISWLRSLLIVAGATALTTAPLTSSVAQSSFSNIAIPGGTQPSLKNLLPDGRLVAFCRDVRINTIVAPSVCTLLTEARNRYNQRDFQGAVRVYDRALQSHPGYAVGYYNRGLARLGLGDVGGAKTDLVMAARLFQGQGEVANQQKALDILHRLDT